MLTHVDTLLEAMLNPASYPHPVMHTIQVIHTHISTVFLTGEFAYKIKKPVNFGFLDLTQLTDRKHFCEPDIRQRLERLENWTQQQYIRLHDTLLQRKEQNHIRACHGDMHLGNIALIDGEITIFDGLLAGCRGRGVSRV